MIKTRVGRLTRLTLFWSGRKIPRNRLRFIPAGAAGPKRVVDQFTERDMFGDGIWGWLIGAVVVLIVLGLLLGQNFLGTLLGTTAAN